MVKHLWGGGRTAGAKIIDQNLKYLCLMKELICKTKDRKLTKQLMLIEGGLTMKVTSTYHSFN